MDTPSENRVVKPVALYVPVVVKNWSTALGMVENEPSVSDERSPNMLTNFP